MKSRIYGIIILSALILSACKSFVPFTNEHYTEFEKHLSEIQFYNGEEISIERTVETEASEVDEHALRIKKNKNLFVITIPKYTPGILKRVSPEGDTLYVQFEPSSEEKVIPFIKIPKYRHSGQKQVGYIYQFSEPKITYGEETYKVFFRQKKFRVDEADMDVYVVGKDNKSDKHSVLKTIYPVLNINPAELEERVNNSYIIVPGIKIER